ncbi:OpgC family protein [Rhabdaerophilum calidifontis]|uniref:OpgC family protein n=1 Tax=Rhabdaerophilum calidifontis TaxID=2604328 RepID=UPI00123BA197|nr:OpgC domain-containing protein [Rhabdaerophilum calidifontis]
MAPSAVSTFGRDPRIDFFRGLALLMIFVNHISGNPWSLATQRSWGFSDSAEVFVLLAGISAALAYGRYFDRDAFGAGSFAVLSRIWTLYITHLMLFLVLAGICVIAQERYNDTSYMEAIGFDVFLQAPAGFIVDVLRLTFLPGYLDILPLYIVLLAALPALFLLARRHWALPLLLSAALYVAVHAAPFNLPNSRTAREWFFNPFAWQILFVIGFTIGQALRAPGGPRLTVSARTQGLVTLAAALFSIVAILVVAPWRQLPGLENVIVVNPASLATITKTDLHPLRLIDALAKFWLATRLVDAGARWLASPLARQIGAAGRHSLEVFALSIVLSVIGGIIATLHGFAPLAIGLVNAGGIAALIALGALLEWRRVTNAALAARPQPAIPLAGDRAA